MLALSCCDGFSSRERNYWFQRAHSTLNNWSASRPAKAEAEVSHAEPKPISMAKRDVALAVAGSCPSLGESIWWCQRNGR